MKHQKSPLLSSILLTALPSCGLAYLPVKYKGYDGKACRTSNFTSGVEGIDFELVLDLPMRDCSTQCSTFNWCKAFEYSDEQRRCKLWKKVALLNEEVDGFFCFHKINPFRRNRHRRNRRLKMFRDIVVTGRNATNFTNDIALEEERGTVNYHDAHPHQRVDVYVINEENEFEGEYDPHNYVGWDGKACRKEDFSEGEEGQDFELNHDLDMAACSSKCSFEAWCKGWEFSYHSDGPRCELWFGDAPNTSPRSGFHCFFSTNNNTTMNAQATKAKTSGMLASAASATAAREENCGRYYSRVSLLAGTGLGFMLVLIAGFVFLTLYEVKRRAPDRTFVDIVFERCYSQGLMKMKMQRVEQQDEFELTEKSRPLKTDAHW